MLSITSVSATPTSCQMSQCQVAFHSLSEPIRPVLMLGMLVILKVRYHHIPSSTSRNTTKWVMNSKILSKSCQTKSSTLSTGTMRSGSKKSKRKAHPNMLLHLHLATPSAQSIQVINPATEFNQSSKAAETCLTGTLLLVSRVKHPTSAKTRACLSLRTGIAPATSVSRTLTLKMAKALKNESHCLQQPLSTWTVETGLRDH